MVRIARVVGRRRRSTVVIILVLLALSAAGIVAAVVSKDPRTIVARVGSQGDEVVAIQDALTRALGTRVIADGDYGEMTAGKVAELQAQRGLAPTGEVDRALYDDLLGNRELLLTQDQRRLVIASAIGLTAIAIVLFAASGGRRRVRPDASLGQHPTRARAEASCCSFHTVIPIRRRRWCR
jgi:peptidoglycan hydrolase-like protein with peptidoglycan-binding domain